MLPKSVLEFKPTPQPQERRLLTIHQSVSMLSKQQQSDAHHVSDEYRYVRVYSQACSIIIHMFSVVVQPVAPCSGVGGQFQTCLHLIVMYTNG